MGYSGQIYADGDTASFNTIRNELGEAVDVASDRPPRAASGTACSRSS